MSPSNLYLFLVFLALVLVGGLAVLLLCALLLALVPVAAAPPPEPELGALLAPLQAVPRPLAPPPPLRQSPGNQHGQQQPAEIFLNSLLSFSVETRACACLEGQERKVVQKS